MKILCVCELGDNRSVHLAWLLKQHLHEAIPVGINTISPFTYELLANWADYIIFTDKTLKIPDLCKEKIKLWDVGEDNFKRPLNNNLLNLLSKYIEKDVEINV